MFSACVTAPQRPAWPADLPPRAYYEQVYANDRPNQQHQSRNEYLQWVKAFYSGWGGVRGWRSIRADILADVRPVEREDLRRGLDELGKRISGEWAKSRGHRVIRGDTIQTWINATYEAGARREYLALLDMVARDVDALLEGSLDTSMITLERYYPDADDGSPFSGAEFDSLQ